MAFENWVSGIWVEDGKVWEGDCGGCACLDLDYADGEWRWWGGRRGREGKSLRVCGKGLGRR